MPKIEVSAEELARLSGCDFTGGGGLEDMLVPLKAELKSSGDVLKIELNDTNRPDLWCVEGVARGLAALSGRRRRYLQDLAAPDAGIEVDPSTAAVRPWIAAFLAEGPGLSEGCLESLIASQEKLASSFGRNRRTAAIGFYRSGDIAFPVRYSAVPPGSVSFVPLGHESPMTLSEILEQTETGRKYAGLLSGMELHPLLTDARGCVLSYPPVINSDGTGRLRAGDRDIFCEVTGTDWTTVQLTASILACNLEDRGFVIRPAVVSYYRVTPSGGKTTVTPLRFADRLRADRAGIGRITGDVPSDADIERALSRMGWDGWTIGAEGVEAVMPPYRHDGLHWVDLVEDIAIGYGIDRFEPLPPEGFTMGSTAPVEDLADAVRTMLTGAGCEELLLPVLTSAARPGTPPGIVRILNPMTSEYGAVRNSLLPGLLAAESASAHAPYPHRLFEIGEVLEDDGGPGGPHTAVRMALVITGNDAGFGEVHSVIALACFGRGLSLSLSPADDPRFIPGRCCRVVIDGEDAGVMGEIHPEILTELGIARPSAAIETGLEYLGGDIQG